MLAKDKKIDNLIIIAGPTGVGKTATSIKLAHKLNAEIISSDSVQIYKNLDIGSAKIRNDEMQGVKHHMLDICKASDTFSVSQYSENASNIISNILKRNIQPIVVGGSGLYIHSLLHSMDFNNSQPNYELRKSLEKYHEEYGNIKLHEKLKLLSETTASKIHPNNAKKVIRAIEIIESGVDKHEFNKMNETEDFTNKFNIGTKLFVLNIDRDILYDRINKRVDIMLDNGLVSEVKKLLNMGIDSKSQSMNSIGYREISAFLDNKCSLEEAVNLIKQNSRKYAKRQLTWFRRYPFAKWIDVKNKTIEEIIADMLK